MSLAGEYAQETCFPKVLGAAELGNLIIGK